MNRELSKIEYKEVAFCEGTPILDNSIGLNRGRQPLWGKKDAHGVHDKPMLQVWRS